MNIVFFDGICILCNDFVDIAMRIDRRHVLHFAPLQGETAKARLQNSSLSNVRSIIFLEDDGTVHMRSNAVLRIFIRIGGFWKIASVFYAIPVSLRDRIYNFIASHRYKWFGQLDACRIPTPEQKKKILP